MMEKEEYVAKFVAEEEEGFPLTIKFTSSKKLLENPYAIGVAEKAKKDLKNHMGSIANKDPYFREIINRLNYEAEDGIILIIESSGGIVLAVWESEGFRR